MNFSVSKVRVVVRVRPFLPREAVSRNGEPVSCVSVVDQEIGSPQEVSVYLKDQLTSRSECYKLDSFYGQEDNNVKQIFDEEVRTLIPGIFDGCNATVFAYGATGSGKTYTMQGTEELPGLMPSAMSVILSTCESNGSSVEMSYYEVYLERCYDLLDVDPKEIVILDDKDGQIHLKGLSRVPVKSMPEFYEAFSRGVRRRKIAHTGLNDVSSRSHGALVIYVNTPQGDTGKLNLIDLAGNEDNRRTCNEGIRIQESAKINMSLFALSNVIYALNNNEQRVPYRESKLTRILQDSLGGTSRALMVACLNPGEYQESVNTVSLAARSRHVSNFIPSAQKQDTPNVKVDMEAKLKAWLESRGKSKSASRPGLLISPPSRKCFDSASSVRKPINYQSSVKGKTSMISQVVSTSTTKRANIFPKRNLFENAISESVCSAMEPVKEAWVNSSETIMAELSQVSIGELLSKEEKETPVAGTEKKLQSPLQKVLSPINYDLSCDAPEESLKDQSCLSLSEAKTPTICLRNRTNNLQGITATPLEKFKECGSHLRENLIMEYIDFLNVATREELLELKGIGPKRAEYILEVRESSPLKSLSDLEMIGISSKQVRDIFLRTATAIFN